MVAFFVENLKYNAPSCRNKATPYKKGNSKKVGGKSNCIITEAKKGSNSIRRDFGSTREVGFQIELCVC